MNLKQINEKSPKAFLEWITTLCPTIGLTIVAVNETSIELGNDIFSDEFNATKEIVIGDVELMCTPYYFDRFGIEIVTQRYVYNNNWYYDIIVGGGIAAHGSIWNNTATTRLSAIKDALPRAFELREKQLTKRL